LCCCCGCRVWTAACHRPECCCGVNFNCKLLFCWTLCHPTAFACVNLLLIPIIVSLYFYAGLLVCFLAYGLLVAVLVVIVYFLEKGCRSLIEKLSCGRCFALDIPSSWYLRTLLPLPQTYVRAATSGSEMANRRMKEQVFDDMNGGGQPSRFNPDMDAGDEGFEEEIMGTPCPALMMAAVPQPVFIAVVPLGLIFVVACSCFLWEDYLTRVVAWKNGDMAWFMADHRMGPGYKAWSWWFQVFVELLAGLTDAWKHMFQVWFYFLTSTFTLNKAFFDDVVSFFEHGANPSNLFRADFQKFRQGVLFWRFILAAVFTMIRTTALINLPRSAIQDSERGTQDPYEEAEAFDMDPYDAYS